MTSRAPHAVNTLSAASLLANLLPQKSANQWRYWLENNRRPRRKPALRLPHERIAGSVLYSTESLHCFARIFNARTGLLPLQAEDAAWLKLASRQAQQHS
jgi:hypothetical protein